MNANTPLNPYELWCVKSNLEHAKTQGLEVIVARLRANGYNRIADAVIATAAAAGQQLKQEED